MKGKEKWTNEVLGSLKGMQPAAPPAYLEARTLELLNKSMAMPAQLTRQLSPLFRFGLSAGVVLLIGINLFCLIGLKPGSQAGELSPQNIISDDYFKPLGNI